MHKGAPQLLTVTPVNSTTVSVSWSGVQCFNGSGVVTHYLVQHQSLCGGAVQNVTTYGPVQTVNISGLTPNTGYTFQVAAASVNKTGPFSETITLGGIYYHDMLHICFIEFHIMILHYMYSHNSHFQCRSSPVSDSHSSELYHCNCLLE